MKDFLQFLASHRTLANLRWDLHMLRLRFRNWLGWQHSKLRAYMRSMPSPVLLNLGSGPRGLDSQNWLNIDAFPDRNVHFLLDFTRPLPFESESLDGVFCEHVLEHFTYLDGSRIASEILRTLKRGASFRIIVPDGSWVMQSYFDCPEQLVKHRGAADCTPMEVVNDYFRQRYEHHFLYDFETMKKLLVNVGFTDVRHVSFGQYGIADALVLDDPKYSAESLYVEATK